jgi:diaminopimelate epimerase
VAGDKIPFTKLHGLGNDFVLIDARADSRLAGIAAAGSRRVVAALADRKTGVGFDQLLVLRPAEHGVHARLDILNADGSRAEMCGNGLRAAALYLWMGGGLTDDRLILETDAGDRSARLLGPRGPSPLIECDMGVPRVLATPAALKKGVKLGSRTAHPVCVNVGNPHAVVFAYPSRDADLVIWGSKLETHRAFPRRTNAEFVRVRDAHVIEVKVWERGVGITQACGTGAVAAATAAIAKGLARSPVEVRFPGGEAEVRWDGPRQAAYLRGHAREVFRGVWNAPESD